MALRNMLWRDVLFSEFGGLFRYQCRLYATKVDLRKLRPMILKRIEKRADRFPVRDMVPVAKEVLLARNVLIHGVSTLLKSIPLMACKFCPEIFIGEQGHVIQTCWGYKHRAKKRVHEWVKGGLNDILVPVETFHLNNMFQSVITHNQRFDFDRVPAVVELCWQAGADPHDENLNSSSWNMEAANGSVHGTESFSPNDLAFVAKRTFNAWETLRSGVQKLLLVYPVKVCKSCSEVHVGPSGHKARLCGVFKYESWKGAHFWMKADVDNLVPPKIVWRRRPQDPPVLVNEGKDFYGRVPAVLDLCSKAGAIVPAKYNCMMKVQGLSDPVNYKIWQEQ
ncbi:APO protein 4, mitochondrial [Gastrolobium bilobum]|uniref:APO protein 4, mitochondrial n=1 Tax=Gastrolobium bilobum TaxID=150636 RepID=UPI002AAF5402|nr:APO protein 4, mitochondrial [Gastrolobium bilobum]